MVRHEKRLGVTDIAWGYDEQLQEYFLTIKDERLSWQERQSTEVNNIIEKVSLSQEGNYFELNTYLVGRFGHRISQETIFTFMRRYIIDPDTIFNTPENMEKKPNAAAKKKKRRKKPLPLLWTHRRKPKQQ